MEPEYAQVSSDTDTILYEHLAGSAPGIFFLGGFNSSMQGLKAIALRKYCIEHSIAFTRFDYRGHGLSSGEFSAFSVEEWLQDACVVFDRVALSQNVLVGSSMGAWIATLLALRRQDRVSALCGIASALDFTQDLKSKHLSPAQCEELDRQGHTSLASCYDHETPYIISRQLIEGSKGHCLLGSDIDLQCPVHLIHGTHDTDIDWRTTPRFARAVTNATVTVTLIPGGDHRLSSTEQLATIIAAVARLRQH
ncbi:MAG: alpha/beta hydrolase [Pseudomonadota bacterium]